MLSIGLMGFSSVASADAGYEPCLDSDRQELLGSDMGGFAGLPSLLEGEILPAEKSCVVHRPRYYVMSVCGALVRITDTYLIQTVEGKAYEIVLDGSYRACYEEMPIQKKVVSFQVK